MPYFGKQRFSPMLFHLFFVAAPGQNQDKCSHLIWSLDRLRIREDEDLLQKFGLVRSKHLCTLVPTALKRFPNHREKHRRIPSEGRFGAFGLLGEHAGHSIVSPVSYRTTARLLGAQPSLPSNSHIRTWLLQNPQLWLGGPLSAKWCLCFLIHHLGFS